MATNNDKELDGRGPAPVADPSRVLINEIAPTFVNLADQVWCFGIADPPARTGIALVAQMAAELIAGTKLLFESSHMYAGAALMRQLIETEYLLFLFARDRGEAEAWVASPESEQKKLFSPAAMRNRANGEFDVNEYSLHCALGGHPRMPARALVDRWHVVTKDPTPVLWYDFAMHTSRVWDRYEAAVRVCSPTNVYEERFASLRSAIATWREAMRAGGSGETGRSE